MRVRGLGVGRMTPSGWVAPRGPPVTLADGGGEISQEKKKTKKNFPWLVFWPMAKNREGRKKKTLSARRTMILAKNHAFPRLPANSPLAQKSGPNKCRRPPRSESLPHYDRRRRRPAGPPLMHGVTPLGPPSEPCVGLAPTGSFEGYATQEVQPPPPWFPAGTAGGTGGPLLQLSLRPRAAGPCMGGVCTAVSLREAQAALVSFFFLFFFRRLLGTLEAKHRPALPCFLKKKRRQFSIRPVVARGSFHQHANLLNHSPLPDLAFLPTLDIAHYPTQQLWIP